jgi:hypothetical protein
MRIDQRCCRLGRNSAGHRAWDVATLLFCTIESEAIEPKLWDAFLEMAGVERAAVWLAHMMLRQVDWDARLQKPSVERSLARSYKLLSDLKRLT